MANIGYNWSFLQLLDNSEKIVIPIIQRDYAQGRTSIYNDKTTKKKDKHKDDFISLCEEVREGFVGSLKKALVNDEKLVLDYIYGAKENGMFNPIDGQQRLTTLFLLHWYIAAKENKLDDAIKNGLRKFTYETRDTSHEFCQELVLHIHPENVASIPEGELSKYIRNCRGYYSTYDADPTVLAMLVMLDALHGAFRDVQEPLWDRLQNISFWVLDLDNFGLTDDLFVKMNPLIERFIREKLPTVDIYNEFSLQHELGEFLSLQPELEGYIVQFERNISSNRDGWCKQEIVDRYNKLCHIVDGDDESQDSDADSKTKKEIDIVIYRQNDKCGDEYYAIELKFPRNKQVPNTMFAFIRDIKFMETVLDSGFNETYCLTFVDDNKFYEHKNGSDTYVYPYFRSIGDREINIPQNCSDKRYDGRFFKPTGKKNLVFDPLNASYHTRWEDTGRQVKKGKYYTESKKTRSRGNMMYYLIETKSINKN